MYQQHPPVSPNLAQQQHPQFQPQPQPNYSPSHPSFPQHQQQGQAFHGAQIHTNPPRTQPPGQPPYPFQPGQQPFTPPTHHQSSFPSGPPQPHPANGMPPPGFPSPHPGSRLPQPGDQNPGFAAGGMGALAQDLSRMDMGGPSAGQHQDQSFDPTPNKAKRPVRAYHQDAGPVGSRMPATAGPAYGGPGAGSISPMPPRPQLGSSASAAQQPQLRHPDRPAHLQNYEHRPMPVMPPGPPLPADTGIPQPPHTSGQRPSGPRNRIDPNQIPSPVTVQEQDALAFENEPFVTASAINRLAIGSGLVPAQVPLSLTDYVAVDNGNCVPRFVRATTYSCPHSDELAVAAQLPIGLMVQPFAELKPGEGGAVPVVDFSDDPDGPPRCQACRGYINPWVQFTEGGQKFVCNLCGKTTEVASSYFCNLDMSGRRMDCHQRAELCRGSVDFVVNKDYWVQSESSDASLAPRTPEPIIHLFAIDVSWSAGRSGMLETVTKGIKELLYPPQNDLVDAAEMSTQSGLVKGAKVGIITFDRTVHFYNLKAGLEQAQMLVVSDLEDVFVPLGPEAMLVDPIESRSIIESLLDSLPVMFGDNQIVESALGGPVQAALMTLRRLGGQVNVFLTSLPTIGPGALKQREDTKLYNTEKEKSLFLPVDPWYRQVAEECSLAGIGINTFLFPSQYIDVATISVLSGITGGEVFFHPRFTPARDACKVLAELRRVLTRETAVSVTMRIRCSNGLRIAEHFGSFLQRNVTDLDFGNMDADKAIAAVVKHEGSKLDEKYEAHFQCALLYTSASGQRRVRCHNLALSVTSAMGNVFRSADMDATIAVVTKQYVAQVTQIPLRDVRASLTETCVKVLLAYRKHCASSTSPGQLILPESFKLFPLYALGLMKTKAMKGGNVSSDVRSHYMRYLKSLGVAPTVLMLYPRMVPLHVLADEVGSVKPNGRFNAPPQMRASYLRMEPDGAYLLENGDVMLLWLGSGVSPQILEDLYGVSNLDELDPKLSTLPERPTRLSAQVRAIVSYYETQRGGRSLPVVIARQNVDGSELEFANMLVEDQNNDAMSYVDYLCFVHKQIQMDLSGERKEESSGIDPSALWRGAW